MEEGGGNGDGRSKVRTQKMMVVARTSRMVTAKEKMDDGKTQVRRTTMGKEKSEEMAKMAKQDFRLGIAASCAGRGPEGAGEAQRGRWA